MYEHRSSPLLSMAMFRRRVLQHAGVAAAIGATGLAIGIGGYMALARMSFVDAYLNASMILAGMGPVGDLPNRSSKLFAGSYALFSAVLLIAMSAILLAPFAHRTWHRLHVEPKEPRT